MAIARLYLRHLALDRVEQLPAEVDISVVEGQQNLGDGGLKSYA
jgi:hypothetical protein